MPWRARTRVNLGGGGKGGDQNHHGRDTNRNLNIGTESRVQIAAALVKEHHHPKMSKLWDSETGPTDRLRYWGKTQKDTALFAVQSQ